jgi:hypothetical protein
VVEPGITVEGLKGRERYPTVVEENPVGHGYCGGSGGLLRGPRALL